MYVICMTIVLIIHMRIYINCCVGRDDMIKGTRTDVTLFMNEGLYNETC